MSRTMTMLIMEPPYEAAASTTAMRIVDAALRQGVNVNVFAFEGAVALTMKDQKPHPNPVHGTSVEEEKHPTTKDLVAGLFEQAALSGARLEWINCGMCVDERAAAPWIEGVRRGGPADFNKWAQESDLTLVIPAK